jgi:hypothetical protein
MARAGAMNAVVLLALFGGLGDIMAEIGRVLAGAGDGVAGGGHQRNSQETGDRNGFATNIFAHHRFFLYLAPADADDSDD